MHMTSFTVQIENTQSKESGFVFFLNKQGSCHINKEKGVLMCDCSKNTILLCCHGELFLIYVIICFHHDIVTLDF